jgi:hypothetical protein
MKDILNYIFGVILAILFIGILIDGDNRDATQVVKITTERNEAISRKDVDYPQGFGSITDKEMKIIEEKMFGEPLKGMVLKPKTKVYREWERKRK